MRKTLGRSAAAVSLMLLALPASACPVCQSDTGQQVRQGIFDGRFGMNLFITLLPFPILVGIVLAIYFGIPRPGDLLRRLPNSRPRRTTERWSGQKMRSGDA